MFLKLDSLLHNITTAGKLFRVTGAVYENERLANTVFVLGTVSSGRAAERAWRRVGQDVVSGRLEHRSWEPFASSPPSCTKCVDALAASGAGEAAAWHHSDDLLPEPHESCVVLHSLLWWLTLGLRTATHCTNRADCLLGCTPASEPWTPAADVEHVWWLWYGSCMSWLHSGESINLGPRNCKNTRGPLLSFGGP